MSTLKVPKYINFANTTAETYAVSVEDFDCNSYIVTTNTSSQLTGDKAIPFTGTPQDNVELEFKLQGGFNTAGASKLKINGTNIPDEVAAVVGRVVFTYINSSWVAEYFLSDGNVGFIVTDMIADDAVTKEKLNSDVAGDGLQKATTADPLSIKLEAATPSLKITAGELGVKFDATAPVKTSAGGVILDLATDPGLEVSATKLRAKVDPSGAVLRTAAGIGVNVNTDVLQINGSNEVDLLVPFYSVAVTVPTADVGTLHTDNFVLVPNVPGFSINVIYAVGSIKSPYTQYTGSGKMQLIDSTAVNPSHQQGLQAQNQVSGNGALFIPIVDQYNTVRGGNLCLMADAAITGAGEDYVVYVIYTLVPPLG